MFINNSALILLTCNVNIFCNFQVSSSGGPNDSTSSLDEVESFAPKDDTRKVQKMLSYSTYYGEGDRGTGLQVLGDRR